MALKVVHQVGKYHAILQYTSVVYEVGFSMFSGYILS